MILLAQPRHYYNDNDPYVAQWLRNLIAAGELPAGDVDERSIEEIEADDLAGYRQCHFFAGIGGWPLALRWAGWPEDRECWTGSCPCQPFSVAGKGAATDDPRHLWPAWFRLIRERRPERVFGEQVSGAIRHGWIDLVFDDLEGVGYSCGQTEIPACAIGAPFPRQRSFWSVSLPNGCNGFPGMGTESNRKASIQRRCDRTGNGLWLQAPSPSDLLAHGISNYVGEVRALSNAIVPQLAAAFVRCTML